jgi:hypothetical protein
MVPKENEMEDTRMNKGYLLRDLVFAASIESEAKSPVEVLS